MKQTSTMSYVGVGILSVAAAFLLSLRFLGHTHAQNTGAPPAPAAATATPDAIPNSKPPPPAPPPPTSANPAQSPEAAATPPTTPAAAPSSAQPSNTAAIAPSADSATPTANGAAPPVRNAKAAAREASELEGFLEPFIYDLVNRRDPFQPYSDYVPENTGGEGDNGPARPLTPAQRYDLDQLHLVGIMWNVKDPKAMFVDPDHEVLVLGRDEGIGNRSGYIAAIREGEVVVVEAQRHRGDIIYKTRVLRIER